MVLTQEVLIETDCLSSLIKATVLSALTFLSALAVRDAILKTMESMVAPDTKDSLMFIYSYSSIVIFVTILVAVLWKTQ